MSTYSFLYFESEGNKNQWEAIACDKVVRTKISDDVYKITLIAENDSELLSAVKANYFIINTLLS